jgi:two-component system chemotaxis sensor kinase CheA
MAEGLGRMVNADTPVDIETVHGVFRAVHSIKGGGGAFGLTTLVEFAHVFETVLDQMRSGKLAIESGAMQSLMRAFDVLSDLVAVARDGGSEPSQMAGILAELDALAEAGPGGDDGAMDFDFQPLTLDLGDLGEAATPAAVAQNSYSISLAPTGQLYARGHEPAAFLRALGQLGEVQLFPDTAAVAPLSQLDLSDPQLRWRMELTTTATREEVDAVFEFLGDSADVAVTDRMPEPIDDIAPCPPDTVAAEIPTATAPSTPQRAPTANIAPVSTPSEGSVSNLPIATTIRVNLDRVDRLINQIGELVIMEAMLAQAVASAGLRDNADVSTSLDGIKQLASNIQESVMSIRAQPLKPVFQRMDRIVREACDATGKQVRLVTIGESTEVDRTVIERLVDPLTHMIRNSVDHGIEAPAKRAATGKPAQGVITLSAAHRSGRVIIEVSDDGGGIDRPRVRDIAEERGLITSGAQLSATEIDNLLFMPGFSSKQEVSAISGRGVGLDVVRREIQSLGGRVTIQSVPGQGTVFSIALPLTLAVLEGMLISVGTETMVLPLSAITETILPDPAQIHSLGPTGRVVANRGDLVPMIHLADFFGLQPAEGDGAAVLVMVETDDGRRAALSVSAIHDQRQVVIKSLENNYGAVKGISAATILGDGRIALIIDPREIVERATLEQSPQPFATLG